jgi:hypothetical protein
MPGKSALTTFDMGDWKSEKEVQVGDTDGEEWSGLSKRLFLWTIPAKK